MLPKVIKNFKCKHVIFTAITVKYTKFLVIEGLML